MTMASRTASAMSFSELDAVAPATQAAVSTFWQGTTLLHLLRKHAFTCMRPCSLVAELDLEGFRRVLDEKGLAIAENQEASLRTRRKLAEGTRGWCFLCSLFVLIRPAETRTSE